MPEPIGHMQINKLILILLLLVSPAYAQTTDVLPDTNSTNSTVILNNQLRQQAASLSQISGYFNNSGLLDPSAGGTGTSLNVHTPGNLYYDDGTNFFGNVGIGTSGYYLQSQGSAKPLWEKVVYLNILPPFTAGDYPVAEDNNVYLTTSITYTKVSEILIQRSGTLRIKFFATDNSGTGFFARIYRNGSAVGTERNGTSPDGNMYSEDISGWSAGDLVQLYIRDGDGGNNCYGGALQLFEGTPITPSVNRSTYPLQRIYGGRGLDDLTFGNLGNQGDLFGENNGGASTTLYVKTGVSTWTAK